MPDSDPTNVTDPGVLLRAVDILGTRRSELAAELYQRLFARQPEIERYFQGHNSRAQGRMLITALRSMMLVASSPREFERQVDQLTARHAPRQIQPEHFAVFAEVLLETLADTAGDTWTPEVEAAWRSVATRTTEALSGTSGPVADEGSKEHPTP